MSTKEMMMYAVVDALQFPLVFNKETRKVTGNATVGFGEFGAAMGLEVTYSYLNEQTKRFGVVVHMSGDLYIMVCSYQGMVGLAVLNASDLKEKPKRSSRSFRSPVMSAAKVWGKVRAGVVALFVQNSGDWSDAESLDWFEGEFFGSRKRVTSITGRRMASPA